MIAHQWRQPLSVINTIMATIKVKQELEVLDSSSINTAFKKIEETVNYLSETIDDFRDYFKPNKIIIDVSVEEIMQKSTTFLLVDMKQQGIQFKIKNDTEINIQTYQNELIQCVINILKNSIDAFREQNTQEKNIKVIIKKMNTHISFSFEDNAGGIDSKIIKRVFEPYFSTKAKNGTGLGLYMTKTIIEEHLNGEITISSSNKRTKVLIELPYFLKKD